MSETEETEYITVYSTNSDTKKDLINILPLPQNSHAFTKEDNVPIKTITIISDLLNNICEESQSKKNLKDNNIYIKSFMTKNIPSVSIKNYLLRLFQHTKMNESTIILILIYIDRVCNINNLSLSYFNIYKLILGAMIVAIKYNEDRFYSTKLYAKLGGVSTFELNVLEFEFLTLINFSLFVEEDLFNKYNEYLISFQDEEEEEE